MKVGMLCSRVRVEEKLLIEAFQRRGLECELLDPRGMQFDLADPRGCGEYAVVYDRSISHTECLTVLTILEGWGIPTVNRVEVARVCGNKLETSLALLRAGVPTPEVAIALSPESALLAIERMGYPVILKPVVGSWGRLLAKVNDRDAAEALLEHKQTLGSTQHSVFYLQRFIEKSGYDLRTFVVGDEVIAGIRRNSGHWITNTARGGTATAAILEDDLRAASLAAARAVGGGILAIDLMRSPDGRLWVNEVNHTMEFRNSIAPTGVDIPGRMVDHVLAVGEGQRD